MAVTAEHLPFTLLISPGQWLDAGQARSPDGIRKGNGYVETKIPLRLVDIRHIAVSGGTGVGLAQDMHGFVGRQDVAH